MNCPSCGSDNTRKYGARFTKEGRVQRYLCNSCKHSWSAEDSSKESRGESKEENSYEQSDDFINIICASRRMLTKEDVLKQFNVDTEIWEVERYRVKTSEGYRKDRSVEWHVHNGEIDGDVSDSGMMLVVPLYHIEVRLIRKVNEIRVRSVIADMIEDAKNYAPKYEKINYVKPKGGMLYEIDIFDLHFGRLTYDKESGYDYDVKIAEKIFHNVFDELLAYTNLFPIERFLLSIGGDFFNVNSKTNTTINGTPQQEDTRYQKTFKLGRELLVKAIDKCSQFAPTDVLFIRGNHDEEKIYYLGDAIQCWYHSNPNVSIDNSAKSRKYYEYGTTLLGFTHGSEEKLEKLPMIMPIEVPELWSKSIYREFHTGDKHHKFDTKENGIVVRSLRSLAPPDAWTYNKGLIDSQRTLESFLWSKDNGLVAQFVAVVKQEKAV